jgi:hypothetical protein
MTNTPSANLLVSAEKIDGDKMEQLTEEQKEKFKKLRKQVAKRAVWMSLKLASLLVLTSTIICLVDIFYVHNLVFTFVSSMISAIMIFSSFRRSLDQEHDRIKEEVKKVLQS